MAGLQVLTATLPSGDIEYSTFTDTEDGVQATVSRKIVHSDLYTHRKQFLRKGRYTWKIEEEHRSILMALPGQPTGIVRQAFAVTGWIDASRLATDPPRPAEVFRFYAPTRPAAEALRDRLKQSLSTKR